MEPNDRIFPTDEITKLPLLKELQIACKQTVHEVFVISGPKPAPAAALDANTSTRTDLQDKADMAHMSAAETTAVKRCCFVCRGVDECERNGKSTPKDAGRGKQKTVPHTHEECLKEKDTKSLVQNLFDTQTFKLAEIAEYRDGSYRLLQQDGRSLSKIGSLPDLAARFRRVIPNEHRAHGLFSTLWSLLDYAYPRITSPIHTEAIELELAQGAAEIFNYTLTVLDRSLCGLRVVKQPAWQFFVKLRQSGQLVPSRNENRHLAAIAIDLMDFFEDELAIRLIVKLARAYAARLCWSEASGTRDSQATQRRCAAAIGFSRFVKDIMMDIADGGRCVRSLGPTGERPKEGEDTPFTKLLKLSGAVSYAAITLEWLRSVILHEWDGKAIIDKYGAVGGAIQLMSHLCIPTHIPYSIKLKLTYYADDWRHHLNLSSNVFYMPFLADRLNLMDVPVEWASWQPSKRTTHLLAFPFLFEPATLVTCFRAINYASMVKRFEDSLATVQLVGRMAQLAGDSQLQLHNKLKIATSNYLVLEIRRDSILKDAMDQLWRRQKRELLRPLKVRMGMDEGEEGVDHGGVQQEFFRLAFGEALNPDYGTSVIPVSAYRANL